MGKNRQEILVLKDMLPLTGITFELKEDNGNSTALLKVEDLFITLFFKPSVKVSTLESKYVSSHIYYSRKAVPEELKREDNSTIIVSDYGPDNGSIKGTGPGGISVNYRNGRYALRRLKL